MIPIQLRESKFISNFAQKFERKMKSARESTLSTSTSVTNCQPSLKTLFRIAEILQVSPKELINNIEEQQF